LTDKSFDDVGIGRHAIHPLPPAEVLVGLQHAITIIESEMVSVSRQDKEGHHLQCDDKAEEKAEQLGSNFRIRRHRSDPLREGSIVHGICDAEHQVGEPRTT